MAEYEILAGEIAEELKRQKEAHDKDPKRVGKPDFHAAARKIFNSHRLPITSEALSAVSALLAERRRAKAKKERETSQRKLDLVVK